MGHYEDEDEEGSDNGVEVQESTTPKINKFVCDICDWLLIVTLIFIVIYGILYMFYEIALGMAHIRWVYNAFLIVCLIDIAMYFITRFAVVGGETNRCLVYTSAILFICNLLVNLLAPAIVLISYELTLEHPSSGSSGIEASSQDHMVTKSPDDIYVYGDEPSQDCRVDPSGFKCGVVKSIRTSLWCMYLLIIPRPLMIYGIITILRQRKKRYSR